MYWLIYLSNSSMDKKKMWIPFLSLSNKRKWVSATICKQSYMLFSKTKKVLEFGSCCGKLSIELSAMFIEDFFFLTIVVLSLNRNILSICRCFALESLLECCLAMGVLLMFWPWKFYIVKEYSKLCRAFSIPDFQTFKASSTLQSF